MNGVLVSGFPLKVHPQMPLPQMLLTFPIQYLEMVESLVRAQGRDVESIYPQCGLSLREANDPETRLTIPQFVALMTYARRYLREGESASQQYLRHMPITINGMVGMAVLSADTVAEALDIGRRYFPLMMPCVEMRREDHGNKVHFRFITLVSLGSPFDETLIEVVIGNMLKLIRYSSGQPELGSVPFTGVEAHFRHERRGDLAAYSAYGDASFKFLKRDDQLILPREVLSQALATRNRSTRMTLEALLDAKLQVLQHYNQASVRVRHLLAGAAEQGDYPDIAQVADRLALSTRTLSRRLAEEGYTLSQLIEEVRMVRAETLLIETTTSLLQIAQQVGYSDLSAFSRAFKRVKKRSPSALRASLKASDGSL